MASDLSYCSRQDVETHLGRKFSGSTNPSGSEAQEICEDVAAEIDGYLMAAGYSLPIAATSPRALALLKHYNKLGAAYRCWNAMHKSTTVPEAVKTWKEEYDNFLNRVRKDEIRLIDATPADSRNTLIFEVY